MQQLSFFEEDLTEWTSDDWQTPNKEAEQIARLAQPYEQLILDAGAGNGQITKYLPSDRLIYAVERNPQRYQRGQQVAPHAIWLNSNYLIPEPRLLTNFDLIVGNPPFSLAMEFIERSLQLIAPHGRILFLLPIDWNCKVGVANRWKKLGARIHHEYRIINRVAYLDKDGIQRAGRQIYDAVFDIRPGHDGAGVSYLI